MKEGVLSAPLTMRVGDMHFISNKTTKLEMFDIVCENAILFGFSKWLVFLLVTRLTRIDVGKRWMILAFKMFRTCRPSTRRVKYLRYT